MRSVDLIRSFGVVVPKIISPAEWRWPLFTSQQTHSDDSRAAFGREKTSRAEVIKNIHR